MDNLVIDYASYGDGPSVKCDFGNGTILIRGYVFAIYDIWESDYYGPIMKWFNNYLDSKANNFLKIDFELTSCNTAVFIGIVKWLKEMIVESSNNMIALSINWFYQEADEDILWLGNQLLDEGVILNLIRVPH